MFSDCIDPTVSFQDSLLTKRPSISDPEPFTIPLSYTGYDDLLDQSLGMYAYSYPVEKPEYGALDYNKVWHEELSDSHTISSAPSFFPCHSLPHTSYSPDQLMYSDSDFSPSSTISEDLSGSPLQHQSPLSQSTLGLENLGLSPPSAPASPLVGMSGLTDLPDASLAATTQVTEEDVSIMEAHESPRPAAESESETPSEEGEGSEYGGSDSSDDDDEYVPILSTKSKRSPRAKPAAKAPRARPSSSTTRPRTSRSTRSPRSPRYSPYPSSSPSPSCSSLSSDAGSPGPRSVRLRHTSSRKKQVSDTDAKSQSRNGASRWGCPHCKYVQQNHRMPDLRRHIAGHSKTEEFVCSGVPLDRAEEYSVPAHAMSEAAEWKGELRVGGCWQVFSRRDALIRHAKNRTKDCVCDALSVETLKACNKL